MVCDKENSAIYRLACDVKKILDHLQIEVIAVHPKRPDSEQLADFEAKVREADIVSFEYWRTALLLLDLYPDELQDKPKMLCHYNPYNLTEDDWKQFDKMTVCNKEMKGVLKEAELVPLAIDLSRFKYNREMTNNKVVQMVSSRIESKKGVLPVAQVCKDLGYKLLLIGSVSDGDYIKQVLDTGIVEFREQVSEEDLIKSYSKATVHVCNSVDGYESGTMPIMEAMACGLPVLTRSIGHVPEINNGENMIVRKGDSDDLEDLKTELKKLMENKEKREKIRGAALKTVRTRSDLRRAYQYEKLFYKLMWPDKELVSVIIPTFNRKEWLAKVLESVCLNDWPAKEIIICDDGSSDGTDIFVKKFREAVGIPIKYLNTGTPDEYNLGLARNLGIIRATGNILIFLDDRYYADPKMISTFVEKLTPKKWLYGNKGYDKGFIENVSCIYRQELIDAGMFNSTIKLYGFQTQELRNRFTRLGFRLEGVDARVKILFDTKNKYRKLDEIKEAKDVLWRLNL